MREEFYPQSTPEWQRPLSGVHSIMMEKLAQAGVCGGVHAHPLSLYLPSRTKLQFYAVAERADTLPLFHLYPYVLCDFISKYRQKYDRIWFLIRKSYERLKLHNNFRSEVIYVHYYILCLSVLRSDS
jgi:hypothetical protein